MGREADIAGRKWVGPDSGRQVGGTGWEAGRLERQCRRVERQGSWLGRY